MVLLENTYFGVSQPIEILAECDTETRFIRHGYSVDNRGQQSVVAEGTQVRSGIETESRSAAY
jgi:hypothetical protein